MLRFHCLNDAELGLSVNQPHESRTILVFQDTMSCFNLPSTKKAKILSGTRIGYGDIPCQDPEGRQRQVR